VGGGEGAQGIADVASSLHMNTATLKGWMKQGDAG